MSVCHVPHCVTQLMKITRTGENSYTEKGILPVSFSELITPTEDDEMIDLRKLSHHIGNSRHSQSKIEYKLSTRCFREFSSKTHCGDVMQPLIPPGHFRFEGSICLLSQSFQCEK